MIYTHAAAALAGAALASVVAWNVQGWRMGEDIAKERLEISKAALRSVNAAQAETIRLQGIKDEAIRQATTRANANKVAAAAAASERDSLRNELADASAKLPSLSHQACLARADALSTVFAQCTGSLEGMARSADGHANDALTLDQAWPTSP